MSSEPPARFSKRHGFSGAEVPVTIREDAPVELRSAIVRFGLSSAGMSIRELYEVVCGALRVPAKSFYWHQDSNVEAEVVGLLLTCQWWEVYDVIEAVVRAARGADLAAAEDMRGEGFPRSNSFTEAMNDFFAENGIGWQLEGDVVVARGEHETEPIRQRAAQQLEEAGLKTARKELDEAILDLSRRPQPDYTGAVQHAMGALESVAREVTSDPKATLGELLQRHKDLLPGPLGKVFESVWGYASETARHLREGGAVDPVVAQLMVDLAASAISYLLAKRA